ncbi:hypothetical protein ACJZ2D_014529 [Fusarium nematophilum]
MSTSENSEPVIPDLRQALQARLDNLVSDGVLTPAPGKRLTIGKDGLPELVDSTSKPKPATDEQGCRELLSQIIRHLDSPRGPQSASWIKANLKLRQLRDLDYETTLCPLTTAWGIVSTADYAAKEDISYMKKIQHSSCINMPDDDFPQRACRLFGIETSSHNDKDVWDSGLDEQMAEKDFDAYTCIHETWSSILTFKNKCRSPWARECVQTHVGSFLMLDNIKSTTEVMSMKPFVLLKLKAKRARLARLRPSS